MYLGTIQDNNGNGRKSLVTSDNLKRACVELGIPDDKHTLRRAARAFDLYYSGKVRHVVEWNAVPSSANDHTFSVASQYDRGRPYQVTIHEGAIKPYCYCTCQDWMKNSGDHDYPDVDFWCKHSIASLLWLHQGSSNEEGVVERIARSLTGGFSTADNHHRPRNGNGNGSKVVNECGSISAKALQDKLNGQHSDSQNNNGNVKGFRRSRKPSSQAPSQIQLDISDPFQEAEQNDIDQIEGRRNGEMAWKLSNGEYCISYRGIMALAEKHNIDFPTIIKSKQAVIAYAQTNGSEDSVRCVDTTPSTGLSKTYTTRLSGKPVRTYDTSDGRCSGIELPLETVCELAKRNAARQLIPLPEIKAVEHKTKLNDEFDWQKAQAKCVELLSSALKDTPVVGTKANVDIIIHELVKDGKLRQDNPSHYDRTEWLIIYDACKQDQDNDGGDKTPPSQNGNPNWREWYNKCVKVSSLYDTGIVINQMTPKHYYRKDRISNEEWQRIFEACKERRETYERVQASKASFASAQQAYKFKHIRDVSGYDVKSKQFVGRPLLNDAEFIAKCQEAIAQVRESKKQVEANEMPLMNSEQACLLTQMTIGKRKLQMDKKLRTWLIESDGTKKKISCREICEQFESKQNPSIVTRLRAGIDDGADISTVELN